MTHYSIRSFSPLLIAVVLVECLLAQGGSRLWRPEERVILTDFSVVEAVAASEHRLYGVTPSGICLYDRRTRQWRPPITALDGYGAWRVRAALEDPSDHSLWIATEQGLVSYSPRLRRFETVLIGGGADGLMFDTGDPFGGIYVHSRSGWQFLPRGGVVPQTVTSLPASGRQLCTVQVTDMLERHPYLRTVRAGSLSDDRLRQYHYTAAAAVPSTGEVFLGTDGMGVVRFDVITADIERLPFGLLGVGASAVTVAEGGVWVATDERASRFGFTFVSRDLQHFEFEQGPRVAGLGVSSVRDLLRTERELWVASRVGVTRLEPGGPAIRYTRTDGLPDDRVLALARGPGGVWVGTARGLAFLTDDGAIRRVAAGLLEPVTALAVHHDTVWAGTAVGLGVTWARLDRVVVPREVERVAELRSGVRALAVCGGALVAATRDRIVWRGPGSREPEAADPERAEAGAWLVERGVATELGRINSLACDGSGVWIGGERGIALYRFVTRDYLFVNASGDLPGAVLDIAVDDSHIWVATEGGLVRLQRRAIVP